MPKKDERKARKGSGKKAEKSKSRSGKPKAATARSTAAATPDDATPRRRHPSAAAGGLSRPCDQIAVAVELGLRSERRQRVRGRSQVRGGLVAAAHLDQRFAEIVGSPSAPERILEVRERLECQLKASPGLGVIAFHRGDQRLGAIELSAQQRRDRAPRPLGEQGDEIPRSL